MNIRGFISHFCDEKVPVIFDLRLLFNLNNKSISVQLRFFIFLKFEIEIIL
jgi:hypothetical protein